MVYRRIRICISFRRPFAVSFWLRAAYRWYLDDDREVTAAVDAVITADTIGAVAYELVQRGVNIIDENYPKVMKALWSDQ